MTPYDHLPSGSPPSGEPGSAEPPAPKRSGSQKRKRNKFWVTVLTDEEEAEALERAGRAGLSKCAYGRFGLLGTPGPRARRVPHVNKQILGDALADLNRSANVLNQFLPYLHAGRAITLGPACFEALQANRRAAALIEEALGRKEPDDDNQGQPPR